MQPKVIAIGYSNYLNVAEIVSIHNSYYGIKNQRGQIPSGVKNFLCDIPQNRIVDNCRGRPCKSIIVTRSGYIYRSTMAAETLVMRIRKNIMEEENICENL